MEKIGRHVDVAGFVFIGFRDPKLPPGHLKVLQNLEWTNSPKRFYDNLWSQAMKGSSLQVHDGFSHNLSLVTRVHGGKSRSTKCKMTKLPGTPRALNPKAVAFWCARGILFVLPGNQTDWLPFEHFLSRGRIYRKHLGDVPKSSKIWSTEIDNHTALVELFRLKSQSPTLCLVLDS